MAIIYAAVGSDGEISESEINTIVATVQSKSIFNNTNGVELFRSVGMACNKVGSQALVDGATDSISEGMRPTLFAIVTEMVLADGIVTKEEQTMLEYISSKLCISSEIANKIIEVMLIKAKGNI